MTKRFGLALLAITFLLAGCEKTIDPAGQTADVNMTFSARWNGGEFKKDTDYDFGGIDVQYQQFTTYLSYITLLKGTEEVQLTDCIYIDFTPAGASGNATSTPTFTFRNIPEGDYTGIRIGYGVEPELNKKTPADFPAGHALAREEEYWLGWRSYIFTKIMGQGDTDQTGSPDMFMIYHCGASDTYKEVTFNAPIAVRDGAAPVQIAFDLKKLFTNADGSLYDIVTNNQTHSSPSNLTVAQYVMGNFGQATSISQ